MDKNELLARISGKSQISIHDASNALRAFTETLTEALVKGDKITFVGFGTFDTVVRAEREARVPGTNKTVKVPSKRVVRFKTSKTIKLGD